MIGRSGTLGLAPRILSSSLQSLTTPFMVFWTICSRTFMTSSSESIQAISKSTETYSETCLLVWNFSALKT